MRTLSLSIAAVITFIARTVHATDGYEEIMARAAEMSARGDHAGAARALEPAVVELAQDYSIAVECAWQHFQAGEWRDAERAYREAIARAPGSKDARIGLAWTLVHEERCEEAAAASRAADDPRGEEVLAACAPARAWTLSASFLAAATPDHPIKTGAAGILSSISGPIGEGGVFGAAHRFVRTGTIASSGIAAFDQHDFYGHVGYWGERWGLVVRVAVAADLSRTLETSGHGGLSAHVRLASFLPAWTGDARLEASASVYDDLTVVRVAPSWAIHVFGPLHVIPGFAFQHDGARAYGAASIAAALEWPVFSVWAGAKYGDENRPAYLAQSVVYDLTEKVAWGAWLGVRVRPWRRLAFEAAYAFDQLRRSDALAPSQSGLHSFSIGPVVTF